MLYLFIAILFSFLGWKLGRKYQDMADILLARRITKLLATREQIERDRRNFEEIEKEEYKKSPFNEKVTK